MKKEYIKSPADEKSPHGIIKNRTKLITDEGIKALLPEMIDKFIAAKDDKHPLIGKISVSTGKNEISEYVDFKTKAFGVPLTIRVKIGTQLRAKLAMKQTRKRAGKKIALSLLTKYDQIKKDPKEFKKKLKEQNKQRLTKPKPREKPRDQLVKPTAKSREVKKPVPAKKPTKDKVAKPKTKKSAPVEDSEWNF